MHNASRSTIPDKFLRGQSFRRSRCAPVWLCSKQSAGAASTVTWSEQVVLQPHSRECCARPCGSILTGPSTSGAR
eukprot:6999304-Prymnesium_polylepis.2